MIWGKTSKELSDKIEELAKRFEAHDKENDRRLDNIEKVLIAQEMNLQTHMKRSDHLEQIVETLKTKQDKDIKPIQRHIAMVEGAFKLLGVLGLLVSILGGLAKLLGLI